MKKSIYRIFIIMIIITLNTPLEFIDANPGIHLIVPNSPLTVGQSVQIEYYTDSEQGLLILYIINPASSIAWTSDKLQCSPGSKQNINVPGVTTVPGTYTVGAELYLSGGGGMISGKTVFQVLGGGTSFDFTIMLSPSSIVVQQGETANYQLMLSYSDPSYSGTTITYQVFVSAPGIRWNPTGGSVIPILTSITTPPGSYSVTVTGSAKGVSHQTNAILIVKEQAPLFDFSLTASSTKETIKAGQSTTFSITASLINGCCDSIALSAEGFPSGASYKLSTTSGTPTFSSTITIETSESTPVGEHTITIKGEGGGLQKDVAVILSVESAVEPDFEMSSTPNSQTITWEQSATYLITINGKGGFSSDVSLAISGLPAGVNSQFNPTTVTPNSTSTLTLKPTKAIEAQTYASTVFASGGGKTKSIVVNLIIQEEITTTTTPTTTASPGISMPPIMKMLSEQSYLIIIAMLIIVAAVLAILILRGRKKGSKTSINA